MDNSILIVFLIIFGFILYIFWNILKKVLEVRNNSEENIRQNGETDPYSNSGPHEECIICLERIKYKVELDCRHCFCGKCIMEYYESVRPSNLNCPYCRRSIRLINAENLSRNESTRDFYDKIVVYNHRNLNGFNYVKILFKESMLGFLLIFHIFFIEVLITFFQGGWYYYTF